MGYVCRVYEVDWRACVCACVCVRVCVRTCDIALQICVCVKHESGRDTQLLSLSSGGGGDAG